MFLDHETILTGDLVDGFELSCILFCWADVYLYIHCTVVKYATFLWSKATLQCVAPRRLRCHSTSN